jgi:hypothetical protein
MHRIIVLLALGCVVSLTTAQTVRIDYDRGSKFSLYKTYRWVKLPATQDADAQFPNQLMQERIVKFVEEALAARGLKRVQTGGDLLVGYQMNVTGQPQFTTFGSGGWYWNNDFTVTTEQTIWTGTLVINLTDPRRNQLVFQGLSSDAISSRPHRNVRRIERGVNKIFEKYPPQP